MGLRLGLYLGILILGAIIGYKDKISKNIESNLSIIQNISLLLLLFIMGTTIGMNDQVISNLFTIGIKAAIISLSSIFFSIVFVRLIRGFVLRPGDENES